MVRAVHQPPSTFPQPLNLERLWWQFLPTLKQFGPTASASPWFDNGFFGRDSLRNAIDLLPWDWSLARRIVISLLHFQGDRDDPETEEEPGKILHEFRLADEADRLRDGFRIITDPDQVKLHRQLTDEFGGFPYYGSIDATCELVRVIHAYCRLWGGELLDERLIHKSGAEMAVREGLIDAVRWVSRKLEDSDLGLFEFQARNRKAHDLHIWRENQANYLHPDGEYVNINAPIASIEAQGLAVDALTMGADLLPSFHESGYWREQAAHLTLAVPRYFWMDDVQYFGHALDRDPASGAPRLMETITLLPAEFLETRIFDEHPEREMYVSGIVRMVFSEEFLTAAGPRMRSLRHADLLDFYDYQGDKVVWPKAVKVVVNGLNRWGLEVLGDELDIRNMNTASLAGRPYEFYFVHPDGRVAYDPEGERHYFEGEHEEIIVAGVPEGLQAWTITALIAAWSRWFDNLSNTTFESRPQERWMDPLQDDVMKYVSRESLFYSESEVEKAYPRDYAFRLNREEGWRRWTGFLRRIGSAGPGRDLDAE
jgi:glycogen debranching enzyme